MDEDSENESFEMLDNIPFQHVSLSMYYKLANILDPESTLKGNNWKLLAEKLGYSRNDIDVFVSQQTTHGRNTLKLFEHYAKKQGSTVNEVYKALEEIERPDALSVLKSGIREIEKTYQESKRRKTRHHELVENTYDFSHDSMSYVNEGYGSFPQGHHKNMMPSCNTYGMYHANYPIPGSAPVGKPFTRHKSHDPQCTSPALPGYKHSSPDFKRQRSMPLSDSMMVRGRDGHSQYMRDVEPMEMSPSIRDDPVPPALAMMRGLPHYNNIHGMPPGVSSIVNSKNPESMFRQPYGGQYKRQTERAGLKLEIPNAGEMYCRQRSADFCSPSPTPTTPSTPLGQLQKLANERTFQPEDGYKDLMKMKMEEEQLQGKIGQNVDGAVKMEYVAGQGVSICDSGRHSDDSSQMSRSRMVGPPNTYPLRLKSTGSCTSSSPTNSSHQLTKSASLPSNMKPAEFRKAFRHIKVFVTYSADDRKHIQRVLGLCKCLEKNGFTCCVDIFHRKLPLEERHGWYQDRFEEADFILVVMSPKYRIEADSCEMENDADDSDSIDSDGDNDVDDRPHRLHTKNIYRLMYREYVQNGERCMRFVPLVFPGMNEDIIPPWMLHAYNRLFYYWPKQYKDLLWMLTKPENRVPEHISLPVNRCSSDTDNNLSTEQSEPCLETD